MAITIDSLDTVEQKGTAAFQTRFPTRDLGLRSFLGATQHAVAMMVYGLLKNAKAIDNDAVPSPNSSSAALDAWAFAVGVPSNAGGYGRNQATIATGGTGTLTGAAGTVYSDGLQAVASDGVTTVALSGGVVLPGGGSAPGVFVAVTKGSAGNLAIGSVLTWISPPAGADPSVTLTSALSGAVDTETDSALLGRIFDRAQKPPKGGAEPDYILWATVAGVFKVYEYPLRSGTGTVDVVITQAGTGQARKPSATVQVVAQAAIDLNRPVTVNSATVLLPYMPNGTGKLIRVRIVPSAAKYNFDWDDTSTNFTVDLYTVGPPDTLRLGTLAPGSLKDAITAGAKPRIQVLATGSGAVPIQTRCTAFVDGGGKTTLTLENPLPTGWTNPSIGDVVFAGGPAVTPIAQAIADYVDSIGPSRLSGYADAVSPWDDTIEYLQVARIALDAKDTDGATKFAKDLLGTPTINGVSINAQGSDDGNGPEILYLSHVAVTQ